MVFTPLVIIQIVGYLIECVSRLNLDISLRGINKEINKSINESDDTYNLRVSMKLNLLRHDQRRRRERNYIVTARAKYRSKICGRSVRTAMPRGFHRLE